MSTSIFINAVIIENKVFLEEGACGIGKNKKESHGEEDDVEGNTIGREDFTIGTAAHLPAVCASRWTCVWKYGRFSNDVIAVYGFSFAPA